jgi:hypothetical protein
MQRTTDRQKTLAAHGVVMSDSRLVIEVLDSVKMTSVEGRVLVHGQEEQTGRSYLMLEGTDAKVYLINYTPEIEAARGRGELRTNSFVRLSRPSGRRTVIDINDMGDAEGLLSNSGYLHTAARRLLTRGMMPIEDGWAGWLGRYQAALRKAAGEIEEPQETDMVRGQRRGRNRADRSGDERTAGNQTGETLASVSIRAFSGFSAIRTAWLANGRLQEGASGTRHPEYAPFADPG